MNKTALIQKNLDYILDRMHDHALDAKNDLDDDIVNEASAQDLTPIREDYDIGSHVNGLPDGSPRFPEYKRTFKDVWDELNATLDEFDNDRRTRQRIKKLMKLTDTTVRA